MAFILANSNILWFRGEVPYEINENDFPFGTSERDTIHKAINEINQKTNVWFRPRQKGTAERGWVVFEKAASSCSSAVGFQGGRQSLACAVGNGFEIGNVVHELMHVLGFVHEHQRTDRDEWISLDISNIKNPNDFQKYSQGFETIGEYDYGSILHYPSRILNENMVYDKTKDTIIPLKPLDTETILGQRGALSKKDIAAINAVYPYQHQNKEDLPERANIYILASIALVIFIVLFFALRR